MNHKRVTRRHFMRNAAGALAAVAAAPTIVPASALGRGKRPAPSNRIVIGFIGLGGNGTGHLRGHLENPEVQVAAVCDVDRSHRLNAKTIAETRYAENMASGKYKGCADYNDFRDLLARPDIDAVSISTPDHWHAIPVIMAAEAGKDIYCEKPLSLTVEQGRKMSDAVKRAGVVFQTGSQLRSMETNRKGCELVRNGRLGELREIHVCAGVHPAFGTQPEMPIPDGFDYDFWLGPAPWAPYTERRCHGTFRNILDYSGGFTDHAAHYCDLAQLAIGMELSGPVEFEGVGDFPRDGLYNVATHYRIEFRYPNGLKMTVTHMPPHGATFYGSEGQLSVGDGGMFDVNPPSLRNSVIGPNEIHLYESNDHHQNWLDCIKTRKETVAPIEQAHRTITIGHIGNIAMMLGRKLRWDPEKENFINDPEADAMLSRAMRAPWML
jgi:predicted dehydrogenase